MPKIGSITPCLWFDDKAEEAAEFYVSIFENSRINLISYYGKEGFDTHGKAEGKVLTVDFELDGQPFTILNGGPQFKFNEAMSLQVFCETQADIDYYWEKLGAGGDENSHICGWLKDRYGLSWQIVPDVIRDFLTDPDKERAGRVFNAILEMKKLDIAELEKAYRGD
ncbi:MAG: VOC family protein [Flavobacteriaceae bacterium]